MTWSAFGDERSQAAKSESEELAAALIHWGEDVESRPLVHFGGVREMPTSLHGNGAVALSEDGGAMTMVRAEVTCKLCLTLLARRDAE